MIEAAPADAIMSCLGVPEEVSLNPRDQVSRLALFQNFLDELLPTLNDDDDLASSEQEKPEQEKQARLVRRKRTRDSTYRLRPVARPQRSKVITLTSASSETSEDTSEDNIEKNTEENTVEDSAITEDAVDTSSSPLLTRVQIPGTPSRRAYNVSRTPRTSINESELHDQLPLSPRKGRGTIEDAFRLLQVSADFNAVTKKTTLARDNLAGFLASLVDRTAMVCNFAREITFHPRKWRIAN